MTENYLVVAMLTVVAFGLEILDHRQVLERADLEPAALGDQTHGDPAGWLGREDSNLRMLQSHLTPKPLKSRKNLK